ncbi:MAG: putative P-loop ATPase fused to an acetyltransferase [uncultured Acidilobus sp. JCHS]|nr:MAG: putative P-loop ATPase fused to an acetyltransferase [uncultured Acidilobus sp. JCHS]
MLGPVDPGGVRRSPEERERIRREAEEASYELGKGLPESLLRLRRLLRHAVKASIASNRRLMVVLSSDDPVKVGVATASVLITYESLVRKLKGKRQIRVLYAFNESYEGSQLRKELVKRSVKERCNVTKLTITKAEDARRYLGTTFQGLVLDLVDDLKPNRVGILTGIVEGGGIIVLQVPSWDPWDTRVTEFKRNLLVPGYSEPRHVFIAWFKRKLLEHNRNVFIVDLDKDEVISGEPIRPSPPKERRVEVPKDARFPEEVYRLALTQDQVNAIRAAEWLIEPPAEDGRKLLVITADRGRGKSCAAGIAMVGLISAWLGSPRRRNVKVVVTSPDLENTQSLMELAGRAFEALKMEVSVERKGEEVIGFRGKGFRVKYVRPSEVPEQEADLVVIDEASGLPVPLLHRIWRAHRRILVASTVHGYEGAGRGFSVRFLGEVRRDPRTELRTYEMEEPIRYSEDDPIEAWLFDVLLLDAEPARLEEQDLVDIREGRLSYVVTAPEELFSERGEGLLRQIFGIYVQAHYRNEPDDLALMADAPHYSIRAVATSSGKVVSAALLAEEGGLSPELSASLLNQDKTKGNIIPDRVIKHLRVPAFGTLRGWRVVRIATHPEVQDKGIGSRLLSYVFEEAVRKGYDWVGSGFGVSDRLVRFWVRNGFSVIHVSPDRNPVSGEFTVLVLRPISEEARKVTTLASRELKEKLLGSLQDAYRGMEPEVAIALLKAAGPLTTEVKPLSRLKLERLWAYLYGTMTYETTNDVIRDLALQYWARAPLDSGLLSEEEEKATVLKALQGRTWSEVARELGVGFEDALLKVKTAMRKLAERYYDVKETPSAGLTLNELTTS